MSPQASRILDAMGLLDAVERAGAAQLTGMTVRAPNGAMIRGAYAKVRGYRGYRDRGLALRRTLLDPMLLAAARDAGARVQEGAKVSDVLRDGARRVRGVVTTGNGGARRELQAPIVVGADGLRSIVGRRLGLHRTRRGQRRLALVSHFRGVTGMGDHGEMHVERDGYLGLADVGSSVTNVAVVVPRARAGAAAGDPATFMDTWISRRPHVAPRFAGAERVGGVLATGPFASAARRAWTPGAALVGDAADFFDPFTGEGIYAAMRGAELLAPCIVEALGATSHRAADTALARYERDRRREFGGKWRVEYMIGTAVAFPALMNLAARSLELRPEMAHTLVGVTGDFVPAREVLRLSFLSRLVMP
jgi:flavin-dependent dehydrogenase